MRLSIWAWSFQKCDPAWPHDTPDIRFVFSMIETRPGRFALFAFSWRAVFLSAHLADFLFAHRRSGDRFATASTRAEPIEVESLGTDKDQRDPDHIAALNLLYPRSIQALSGVNSEDQDDDQVSQIFRPKGDCAGCRAVNDGRPCHCRRQKCLERSNPECLAAQAADARHVGRAAGR